MLLTEEEAKTKWCPYRNARPEWPFPSISGPDVENLTIAQSPFNCIASQCMAWQWTGCEKHPDGTIRAPGLVPDLPKVGFCGLAGKPSP